MNEMRYEGNIFRPPNERRSYLLQVTIGCSHNACTFCGMYKDKRFRIRPLSEIMEDIAMAKQTYGTVRRVFLCDGDAIAVPAADLLEILHRLKKTFPEIEKISTYAGPKSTLSKSEEDLRSLHENGLTTAYLGVESGDDQVLRETCKGVDAAQMLEAGQRLKNAGMNLFAMVLIGLAGEERSMENAVATAEMINRMRPDRLAALTLMPVPGTKMYRDIEQGKFRVLNATECLTETRELIRHIKLENLYFASDHASNYVPVKGILNKDKAKIIELLDHGIAGNVSRRSQWQRGL